MSKSKICDFYADQYLFITGGTGFMGKLLIEKLLRSTNVANIYVLVRPKKGKNVGERLDEMFQNELFGKLKTLNPEYRTRVTPIVGDVGFPGLGLSSSDREELISNVNIIFHLGASVRFFENIKSSYHLNVEGTRNLLMLSKQVKNLKSVIHVSTVLVRTDLNFLDEKIYDSADLKKIEDKLGTMSANEVTPLMKSILQTYPTIYFATKTLAEMEINRSAKELPVGIVRPSMVNSTYKEPLEGWIDGLNAGASLAVGAGTGSLHVGPFGTKVLADFVPGDLTTAALIASAWDVNQRYIERPDDIPVYNYTSTVDCPLTWQECWELTKMQFLNHYPLSCFRRLPKFIFTENLKVFWFLKMILHYFPAGVIDLWMILCLKRPQMVTRQQILEKFLLIVTFYNGLNRTYKNSNVKEMWHGMNEEDKRLFPFDLTTFQWLPYIRVFVEGLRRYVFKDAVTGSKL